MSSSKKKNDASSFEESDSEAESFVDVLMRRSRRRERNSHSSSDSSEDSDLATEESLVKTQKKKMRTKRHEQGASGQDTKNEPEGKGKKKRSTKPKIPRAAEKVDKKKKKQSTGGKLEAEQPSAEATSHKQCPLEQIAENLMGSLLRRNVVISVECSPCNKTLLECFGDAVMESLLTACDSDQGRNPFEAIVEALVERLSTTLVPSP